MNAAPVPPPGARVLVTWTDGRSYPATVIATAPGYAQIRWDSGGVPQWAPLHALATLPAPPVQQPAPGGWGPRPPQQQAAPPPQQQAAPPPQQQAAPPPQQQAAPPPPQAAPPQQAAPPPPRAAPKAAVLPSAPAGPPPRPTTASLRELPRGLVYEPTGAGPGTGKAFFILFGFISTLDADVAMRLTDLEHLGDDVAALRAAGYRVVVDLHGELGVLNAALAGAHPDAGGLPTAGVFWGGHGDDDGTIATHEGGWIAPEQIAPEVAQKGTVKLFVMSACHQGSHTSRWQKAIGPQAQIIGWGAPITNQRAIEFLVPDDDNARGFDDLLEKHLGARRVAADGPLVEVKALARQHEDRVAMLLLPLEDLVQGAQKRLTCKLEKARVGEAWYLEVRTPSSKDYPTVRRTQVVRVAPMGAGDGWIYLSSLVGPHSDALDLARGLRVMERVVNVRLTLTKLTEPDGEFVVVESVLRRRRLDPYTFTNSVTTVGTYADRLEDMFFGSDKR
jgi:hypothetical protein